jgi:Uri superfamily endonuclease
VGTGARDLGLPSAGGTYALLLGPRVPTVLQVGRLGPLSLDAPLYLYVGSAFGPGGLAARLAHHLGIAERPHWHVDHLRAASSVLELWTTTDSRRLECSWASATRALRGARAVPGFGASDCDCVSHLVALHRSPTPSAFRRHLAALRPACSPIRRHRVADPGVPHRAN